MNIMQELEQLKKINWKRHLHTAAMVAVDFKVLGLVALSGMTLYGIGWDTVIRPSMEALQSRDNAIKEQNESLEKRQQIQREYGDLEQKLANLETHMLILHQGASAKIVSVTEAAELNDLALGKNRAPNLPELPAPHNARTNVDLKPVDNNTLDILHPNDAATTSTTNTPAPAAPAGGPLGAGTDAKKEPGASSEDQAANAPMPVERYNYELTVTGTYPALMDLLNQLVTRKKLVKINKVTINVSKTQSDALPDAKDYPDYPLKLDMIVSLSLFMYEDNNAAPLPGKP